jgi:hypothetical protein
MINHTKCRHFFADIRDGRFPKELNNDIMTLKRAEKVCELSSIIEAKKMNLVRFQSLLKSQLALPSLSSTSIQELNPYLCTKFVNEYQGLDKPGLSIDPYIFSMLTHSNNFSNLGRSISSPLLEVKPNLILWSFLKTALENNTRKSPIRAIEALQLLNGDSFTSQSDILSIPDEISFSQGLDTVNNTQGTFESFPMKLHRLLKEIERIPEKEYIVRFLPNGESFEFLNMSRFETELMKIYFPRMKSFASFQRQLNLYKFRRVSNNQGVYFHPYFHRDYPSFCGKIKRSNAKLKCERKQG